MNKTVLFLGDSIMYGVSARLVSLAKKHGHVATVDAVVGRSAWSGVRKLDAPSARGFDIYVIGLGTNGGLAQSEVDDILTLPSTSSIYLVTVKVPRLWRHRTNRLMHKTARANRGRVAVIDWRRASKGKPELFYPDGYHPNPAGQEVYLSLIEQEVWG